MNLDDLTYNGTVQLKSDAAFRGYVVGRCLLPDPMLGDLIVIAVSKPGATGKRGNVRLPLSDLAPVAR